MNCVESKTIFDLCNEIDLLKVVVDALAAHIDDLTLMNNALTAELKSHTAVDAWEMVRPLKIHPRAWIPGCAAPVSRSS